MKRFKDLFRVAFERKQKTNVASHSYFQIKKKSNDILNNNNNNRVTEKLYLVGLSFLHQTRRGQSVLHFELLHTPAVRAEDDDVSRTHKVGLSAAEGSSRAP